MASEMGKKALIDMLEVEGGPGKKCVSAKLMGDKLLRGSSTKKKL